MRFILTGAAALLLAGCGGEEYPVPVGEAFVTLSSVGTPSGLYPLPVGVNDVSVSFTAIPHEHTVKWYFSHAGDNLATIFAKVEPSGDKASNVSVHYVEGTAPDENWRNGQVRDLLRRQVQQLVVEAVDSKFEGRPFDRDLRAKVSMVTASASMGSMMKDVGTSFDAEIKRRDKDARDSKSRAAMNPRNASKPMTDLSKYN